MKRSKLTISCIVFAGFAVAEDFPNRDWIRTHPGRTILDARDNRPYEIAASGDRILLSAGLLHRRLHVSHDGVRTDLLTVDGVAVVEAAQPDVSFRITRAEPNRNPMFLMETRAAGLSIEATEADGTDTLKVSGPADPSGRGTSWQKDRSDDWDALEAKTGTKNSVAWVDPRTFNSRKWGQVFNSVNTTTSEPEPGVTRLEVRARALDDKTLAGVVVCLVYEVYEGYPVVRKWVEFRNGSASWIKLDQLTLDDIDLAEALPKRVSLTPGERGAGASIVAFSNAEETHGVMVASEIPSALRQIGNNGSSGYTPKYFEWVLGPGESFTSEPTFIYAFSGPVMETVSALTRPLDRAVESGFRRFLRRHVGIASEGTEIPAPLWATWSNFGPVVTDAIVREQAEIAARCGFVLFELDDGWQRGRLGIEPHPETFPKMVETAEHVRSLGLRLGLWISSFRLPDEKDFDALPDAAVAPRIERSGGLAMSFSGSWHAYYANDLLFMHDHYGATYFKQDFTNIKFGDLGAGSDARTRKESLLRGLRGLLGAQDILRRHASGVSNEITHEIYWGTPGVPADLAALKHAAIYHIPPNDYSGVGHRKQRVGTRGWERYRPDKLRGELIRGCHNARQRFYAHRGLPLECIEYYGAATVNWKGSLTPEVQDRQVASWLMGAPLLFAGDLASLTEEHITHYRERFGIVKRLERDYGIYRHFQYSGVPTPTDSDWHWWGKLNDKYEGAVVVIRGNGGTERRKINIPWVRPEERYAVTALFSNTDLGTFTGEQLQAGALELPLPKYGQEILEVKVL